jgi:hypothetical protein
LEEGVIRSLAPASATLPPGSFSSRPPTLSMRGRPPGVPVRRRRTAAVSAAAQRTAAGPVRSARRRRRPDVDDLLHSGGGECTSVAAARVAVARSAAIELRGVLNSEIPASHLDALAPLSSDARAILRVELERERLTAAATTASDASPEPWPISTATCMAQSMRSTSRWRCRCESG